MAGSKHKHLFTKCNKLLDMGDILFLTLPVRKYKTETGNNQNDKNDNDTGKIHWIQIESTHCCNKKTLLVVRFLGIICCKLKSECIFDWVVKLYIEKIHPRNDTNKENKIFHYRHWTDKDAMFIIM